VLAWTRRVLAGLDPRKPQHASTGERTRGGGDELRRPGERTRGDARTRGSGSGAAPGPAATPAPAPSQPAPAQQSPQPAAATPAPAPPSGADDDGGMPLLDYLFGGDG
jgi:hypothetical protein